jgi:hypothetical protein
MGRREGESTEMVRYREMTRLAHRGRSLEGAGFLMREESRGGRILRGRSLEEAGFLIKKRV